MRQLLLAFACAALPGSGFAQDLTELPDDTALPAPMQQVVTDAQSEGDTVELVRRWQGDVTGDGAPDTLLQAVYGIGGGGNATISAHWLFDGHDDSARLIRELLLPESVKAARVEGRDLVLTLYLSLPDDAHCCPSGEQVERIPLN